MKVITLKQPWATLVSEGIKEYEFRSWKYNYRGEILIHAGSGIDEDAMKRVRHLNFKYPSKKILAKIVIEDCIQLDFKKCIEINKLNPLIYGDKIRDGYAWKIGNVEKVYIEKEITGKLGIWNYEE